MGQNWKSWQHWISFILPFPVRFCKTSNDKYVLLGLKIKILELLSTRFSPPQKYFSSWISVALDWLIKNPAGKNKTKINTKNCIVVNFCCWSFKLGSFETCFSLKRHHDFENSLRNRKIYLILKCIKFLWPQKISN